MKDSDYIFSLVGTDLPPRAVALIKSLDAKPAEKETRPENDSEGSEEPIIFSMDTDTEENETEA